MPANFEVTIPAGKTCNRCLGCTHKQTYVCLTASVNFAALEKAVLTRQNAI